MRTAFLFLPPAACVSHTMHPSRNHTIFCSSTNRNSLAQLERLRYRGVFFSPRDTRANLTVLGRETPILTISVLDTPDSDNSKLFRQFCFVADHGWCDFVKSSVLGLWRCRVPLFVAGVFADRRVATYCRLCLQERLLYTLEIDHY